MRPIPNQPLTDRHLRERRRNRKALLYGAVALWLTVVVFVWMGGFGVFAALLLIPLITLMLTPIGLAVGLSYHIFTAFERWLTRLVVGGPRR